MIVCWGTIQYSDGSVYFFPCFRGEPCPSRVSPADRTAALYVSAWQNTCPYSLHWEPVCCFYRFCHLIREGCETTWEGTQREKGAHRISQDGVPVPLVHWLGYGLIDGNQLLIPGRSENFPVLQSIQTIPTAHPALPT